MGPSESQIAPQTSRDSPRPAAATHPSTPACDGCAGTSVTVVIPCHNEEGAVAGVVQAFRRVLPAARVLVGDNASSDRTADVARAAGAEVIPVPARGKGRTIRRLTEVCTSEVVIMVDGDGTYDPSVAAELVHLIHCRGYDLVNVARTVAVQTGPGRAYRAGHVLGNQVLTRTQRTLTGIELRDILTGYKAMSRRFVTSLPVRSAGFQLEVEIAAHAVAMDFGYTEISAPYSARGADSMSKLATYRDGMSILRMILRLYRDLHPFAAFAVLSVPWFLASLVLVARPVYEYLERGEVPRFPSLIAGMALFVVAMLLLTSGWLLSRVTRMRRDLLQLTANEMERSVILGARRLAARGGDQPRG